MASGRISGSSYLTEQERRETPTASSGETMRRNRADKVIKV
jgi:hypothetical protein